MDDLEQTHNWAVEQIKMFAKIARTTKQALNELKRQRAELLQYQYRDSSTSVQELIEQANKLNQLAKLEAQQPEQVELESRGTWIYSSKSSIHQGQYDL